MLVEMRPITSIRPYENNPRRNDHAVDAVATSIAEFGFRQPIVVDDEGVIIVGHTRYKAALKVGMIEVPVHVAVGLSPGQAKEYRLADNQTATHSQWDEERLLVELLELQKMNVDLTMTGFSSAELLRLLAPLKPDGLTDPDDVPAPPAKATTKPGDIWLLGEHRLHCADAGRPDDVDRLLDGQPVHMVNTTPPNPGKVKLRSNSTNAAGLSSFPADANPHDLRVDLACDKKEGKAAHNRGRAKNRLRANDFVSDEKFHRLLHAWFGTFARVLLPGHTFYIWGGYANICNYPVVLKASGLYFSQAIIWVKEHFVSTRKDFRGNHEWCLYGWREGAAHRFYGPKNVTDVWSIKNIDRQSTIHLTEKPVELAMRAIEYSSKRGENVLDLFGGGGSTLIAAEQAGRKAFLMERDPLCCDVIINRFEQFAGHKAVLQSKV
jgi:DNA modification methylase